MKLFSLTPASFGDWIAFPIIILLFFVLGHLFNFFGSTLNYKKRPLYSEFLSVINYFLVAEPGLKIIKITDGEILLASKATKVQMNINYQEVVIIYSSNYYLNSIKNYTWKFSRRMDKHNINSEVHDTFFGK